jgi:hypothetical protein
MYERKPFYEEATLATKPGATLLALRQREEVQEVLHGKGGRGKA